MIYINFNFEILVIDWTWLLLAACFNIYGWNWICYAPFFIIIDKDETTQNSVHLLIQSNCSKLNLTQACLKQLSVSLGTIDWSAQNGLN